MKKSILLITILTLFFSCSSDDDNTIEDVVVPIIEETEESAVIRISQVDAKSDLVVLSNLGTTTTNVGTYWLCLGPGTYVNVADATTESTNLAPNESVTLSYDVNQTADGLGIFTENSFTSSDPDILIDYVQWGAGNQARVGQAVTAGRWNDATAFVASGDVYNFTGQASQFGSSFYESISEEAAEPVVRVLKVDADLDQVWLSNLGSASIDVADYWLCLGPGTYRRIGDITTLATVIEPGANIMVSYDVNEVADGLGLFSTNTSFGSSDPTIFVDYVQWGAANQARVDQAVTAGRWDDADNFLAIGDSYTFTGEADEFGSTFYSIEAIVVEAAVLRILQVNAATDQVWLSNFGGQSIDVADYWLCLGPGTYVRVANATTGTTIIEPGANIMLNYNVNEIADGLSVFSSSIFGSIDPTILVDYVQWGAGEQARVDQAVTAGRWNNATNFASGGGPIYTFTGEASDFGSIYW